MSILGTLFNTNPIAAGSSVIGQAVKDIVGTFHLSPEAKLEFDRALAENEFKLKQMDAELESKLADTASANIQAEAKSGNAFTVMARPMFLYNCNLIIFCNYVLFPLIGRPPINFPEALFWLFGSCVLGYTGARSWDKRNVLKEEK